MIPWACQCNAIGLCSGPKAQVPWESVCWVSDAENKRRKIAWVKSGCDYGMGQYGKVLIQEVTKLMNQPKKVKHAPGSLSLSGDIGVMVYQGNLSDYKLAQFRRTKTPPSLSDRAEFEPLNRNLSSCWD